MPLGAGLTLPRSFISILFWSMLAIHKLFLPSNLSKYLPFTVWRSAHICSHHSYRKFSWSGAAAMLLFPTVMLLGATRKSVTQECFEFWHFVDIVRRASLSNDRGDRAYCLCLGYVGVVLSWTVKCSGNIYVDSFLWARDAQYLRPAETSYVVL